jgi:predicted nucleotidyltransferase component of viral defense system
MAYLHEHKDFKSLLDIVANEMGIEAGLVEKDYWIMHTLYGLKKKGFQFELKGGTSLSKGFQIIDRFSEDIDIHITPESRNESNRGPSQNQTKSY